MKNYSYLVLIILISLFSCKQTEKKDEKKTLSVGAMSSLDYLPLAVAQKLNLFEKNGIKVNIEKFYSANDRDAAFQSQRIDGTVTDYTGAILQKAGGIELKLTSACNAPFAILASPQSKLTTIQSLEGKKIAVSRNTIIDFCIDAALQSQNISETNINKVEINKIPIRFEMLLKGEIDATALPDPFITMAKSKGCTVITDISQMGYKVTGFAFSQQAIDAKNKEIHSFYKAYNEAVDYIKSHPTEDIKDILIKEIGFPEELISQIQLPAYSHAQPPAEKDIQATVNWLKSKKLISDTLDGSEVLDNQFVK